jgi:Zn finger protein HypA/HybF involved in hydrogenase expression
MSLRELPETKGLSIFAIIGSIIALVGLVTFGIVMGFYTNEIPVIYLIPVYLFLIFIIIRHSINIYKLSRKDESLKYLIPKEKQLKAKKRFFADLIPKRKKDMYSLPTNQQNTAHSAVEIDKLTISIVETENERTRALKKYLLSDIPTNISCGICKLIIDAKEEIIQCPSCQTHFHYEHIDYWLLSSKNCPVCGYNLI